MKTARESGRAIIEVLVLGILLLIPVVYILISMVRLQAATLAVAQAARDAGRLIETADGDIAGDALAVAAVALQDQNISADGMQVRIVPQGADCLSASQIPVSRRPGATYDLCVVAVVTLPGVPTILAGSDNTVTGVYTVHMGLLREGR